MKKHTMTNLTREQIDLYRHASGTERNSLERQIDSFEQDALDGWMESRLSTTMGMKKADKAVLRAKTGYFYMIAGVAFVAVIAVIGAVAYFGGKTPQSPHIANSPVKVETSEILLPEHIDTLQELPRAEQVRISSIKTEQRQIALDPETVSDDPSALSNTPVGTLPEKAISGKPQEMKVRKTAAEISLSDLKLVDYTKYRSNPVVPVERIVITGTSADLESADGQDVSATKETIDIPYIDYLAKTAKLVSKEKWKEALQRLDIILQAYPDDVNAHFYAGICAYNLRLPEKSMQHFSFCQTSVYDNFSQEAQWYEARTYLQLNDKPQAILLLKTIVQENNFYASQAKKLLKELQ